jgi:hypothetical protein
MGDNTGQCVAEGEKKGEKGKKGRRRGKAGALFEVLDEAQSIKNPQALASHAAWALKVRPTLPVFPTEGKSRM